MYKVLPTYRKQQILRGTKLSQFLRIFDKTRKFSLLISMARSNMYCNLTKSWQFSLHSAKNQWTAKVLYRGGFVVYGTSYCNHNGVPHVISIIVSFHSFTSWFIEVLVLLMAGCDFKSLFVLVFFKSCSAGNMGFESHVSFWSCISQQAW